MMMHGVLARQLKRHGLEPETLPRDLQSWSDLLASIDHAYQQADQDRYLLERSLALSSDEMGALHRRLAAERDLITRVTCSLVEGVCAVDNDGDVLFLNPEARRLLGIAADADVSGCPLVELAEATSADGKTLDSVLREFTAASTGGADEPRLIVNGDQSVFITFTVSALGAQQDAGGVVLTLHDVTERKRMESERRELNNRLIAMSRQAGMAEVASDVLHNVGNVLNSVNVSASVATDLVRESRREGIVKLARLLEANRGTLPEFLATDPAGSRAIEYLAEIGVELMREQGQVCDELAKVRKSIDHIRDIVGAQQSWARCRGEREPGQMAHIVDEALRVLEPSLARHGVTIERDFAPAPAVYLERHQALQAMINLINNAKQAVSGVPGDDRRITIRIRSLGPVVRTQVIDRGCGIPAEHLSQIFVHGFTTRADGHGFGLHSAANSAKAMGGSLAAASEGPGCGATFTLDVPVMSNCIERAA